jgi:hypothetical protein
MEKNLPRGALKQYRRHLALKINVLNLYRVIVIRTGDGFGTNLTCFELINNINIHYCIHSVNTCLAPDVARICRVGFSYLLQRASRLLHTADLGVHRYRIDLAQHILTLTDLLTK